MHDLATWQVPEGGMFFWLTLPPQIDAATLLPLAIEQGVSFVPGVAFFAGGSMHHSIRLSFVTEPAERIVQGVAALAQVIRRALAKLKETQGRLSAD
jgi:2-aminoadipate transaminase